MMNIFPNVSLITKVLMNNQQYKLPAANKENKRQYISLTAVNLLPAPPATPYPGSPDLWNLEILHL